MQELALSPVFGEFPQRVKDWRYEIEDAIENLRDAFEEKIKKYERRLENLTDRISPLQLAAKLNEKKTRLALLRQKQSAAAKTLFETKHAKLKIEMASLDALSPLAVLNRGFSIVENEQREILRDADKINENEVVKIRLARGRIKAKFCRWKNKMADFIVNLKDQEKEADEPETKIIERETETVQVNSAAPPLENYAKSGKPSVF